MGLRIAVIGIAASLVAAASGCGKSPQARAAQIERLRGQLVQRIESDMEAYNSRSNHYGPPAMGVDGFQYVSMRTERKLAVKPDEINVEDTSGEMTKYRAVVPISLQTFAKHGATEQACSGAPEEPMEPTIMKVEYTYNTITKEWAPTPHWTPSE